MEIRRLTPSHPDWPKTLAQAAPAPERLFVRGPLPERPGVAVVGTRKMTPYGRACVELLVPEIVRLGLPVVSGLALGIDGAAHEAALEAGGRTVAVIGSGADDASIYPRAHFGLAKRILEAGGAVVSEYPTGAPGLPHHFPERNRIVAALSSAVLVIEAPKKSGAMITARLALETGRDVWAVPGPITHPNSEGPNALIRDGATPISCADDIALALGAVPRQERLPMPADLSPEERAALDAVASGKDTADALAKALG
ncbi:MAG TPA: DNA-processing protein DprA, partial [Patescibacteria group bacterium]|nr:DNA-processing protein DprA [Patescibacteria group bacterium]